MGITTTEEGKREATRPGSLVRRDQGSVTALDSRERSWSGCLTVSCLDCLHLPSLVPRHRLREEVVEQIRALQDLKVSPPYPALLTVVHTELRIQPKSPASHQHALKQPQRPRGPPARSTHSPLDSLPCTLCMPGQAMAKEYGHDISKPATNAREAIQWVYFGYLGTEPPTTIRTRKCRQPLHFLHPLSPRLVGSRLGLRFMSESLTPPSSLGISTLPVV